MTNFLGEFECRLDAKGRIALPVALRKQIPLEAEGRFVVNRGFEQHLVLYPFPEWRRVTADLDRLNPFVKKHRDFARYFHRGATEMELDGSGRLLLPRRLLDYAGIRDDMILLAYARRIECWDPTLYENLLSDEPADFARLAEEIMGGAGRAEPDGERFPALRDLPLTAPNSRHRELRRAAAVATRTAGFPRPDPPARSGAPGRDCPEPGSGVVARAGFSPYNACPL